MRSEAASRPRVPHPSPASALGGDDTRRRTRLRPGISVDTGVRRPNRRERDRERYRDRDRLRDNGGGDAEDSPNTGSDASSHPSSKYCEHCHNALARPPSKHCRKCQIELTKQTQKPLPPLPMTPGGHIRRPPPIPVLRPMPRGAHEQTYVTVDEVQEVLRRCAIAAHSAGKLSEGGKLGRGVQDIADAFLTHKPTLAHHVIIPTSSPTRSQYPTRRTPSLTTPTTAYIPTPTANPQTTETVITPLTRALTSFHKTICALTGQLNYYKTHALPFPHTKKRKINKLFGEFSEAWRDLIVQLTFCVAQESEGDAKGAVVGVRKLAVATGDMDWEDLTLDDAGKMFVAGEKFLLGFGVERNYEVAFRRYMAAAKLGSPDAMTMLGVMFEHGLGRPKDMAAAIRWYQQSANHNHPDALSHLAQIHLTGKGVPTSPATAYDLYLRAAQVGHLDSMVSLGHLLESGTGTPPNPTEAIHWYRLAATQNNSRGQNALGSCYYRGVGVEKNYGEAVLWYRRAAESGDPNAHNNLGICYEEGVGVARDLAMAKTLYKLAAEARHGNGVNNLGFLVMGENNFMEAIQLFHLAMSLGSVDAAYNLGTLYESGCKDSKGQVLTRDLSMAARYYKEAADKNHPKSLLRLSTLFLTAPRTSPIHDPILAAHYLTIAASPPISSAEAQNMLGEITELGLASPEGAADHISAGKWYRKAVKQGHGRAMYNLAALYEVGVGVGRDLSRAGRLYREAEKRGSVEARERLEVLGGLELLDEDEVEGDL